MAAGDGKTPVGATDFPAPGPPGPRTSPTPVPPVPPRGPAVRTPGDRSVAAGGNARTVITGDNVTHVHLGLGAAVIVAALALGGVAAAWYWPGPAENGSPAGGRPPLAVTTRFAPNPEHCDGWIFPGRLPGAVPVPAGAPTAEWAHAQGGVDGGRTALRLVVQGTGDHDVVLLGLRAVEQRETRLAPGTTVALRLGCGGDLEERHYQVRLGEPHEDVTLVVPEEDGSARRVEKPFGYTVSATDAEVFSIEALAPDEPDRVACDCVVTWKLALDWAYKGEQGTLIVDDRGAPFRTGDLSPGHPYPHVVKAGLSWR
ncbi:hypothetical protein [Streptomyces thermolilacinus]|uniref:Transcriptional regulator n=1 Tax=Streptomyces thermolilacinus SPC6 TaxID=1306406 RepID=A0A1D3DN72_9ACTN|nr:hypothetical protein [Streptomyces thermolilacinus]OEJ93773.1 hypothetical protein J116_004110 [Streptomyces thermolilacinus SPC6]